MATGRANITVAPKTAMDLRAVRVEMSRDGGVMLSVDEVLRRLIACFREHDGHAEEKAAP